MAGSASVTQLPGTEPRDGDCPHCLIREEACRVLRAVHARHPDTATGEAVRALLEVAAATAAMNGMSLKGFVDHATAYYRRAKARR